MTTISVNPTPRRLRAALAQLLSDFAREKGLTSAKARPRRSGETSRQDERAGGDVVWMDRGRVFWEFHIMPGPRARKKLGAGPGLSGEKTKILCVDSAGNVGGIDQSALLDFFDKNSETLDRELIGSLKKTFLLPSPAHSRNPHFKGTVIKNHQFLKDHYSLRIRADLSRPAPGQFLQALCDPAPHIESPKYAPQAYDVGALPKVRGAELLAKRPFLRRPFGIASYGPLTPRNDIRDARRLGPQWSSLINWSEFEVIYRLAPGGPGTGALAKYKTGDEIDAIGPLGKGFKIQPQPDVALLVGGGIGATPMPFLAEELARSGVETILFVGAQDKSRIPFRLYGAPKHRIPKFERFGVKTIICTDNGSAGRRALVTAPLEKYLDKRKAKGTVKIYACGPRPMLGALGAVAARYGVPCEALLEERMACGFGACISCVCALKETDGKARFARVCAEGPAFDAEKVMWHA